MRSVWNPARMQRDGRRLDPAARSEISAHVKQHFIGFNVVVHPRNLYGLRVRIQQARRERANDVTANLECLMDRRRLVNRASNRLEILRIKREWINVAIPADHIEGMMRHRHLSPA